MKDLVSKAGLDDLFYIESAATSTEEIGNEVYPPAKRKLAEHGISCKGKTARQMTRNDYDRFDLLIGMDAWNIRNMNRIIGSDPEGKIRLLLDYTNRPGDVADPWCRRSLVHRRFRSHLARCYRRLHPTAEILDRPVN